MKSTAGEGHASVQLEFAAGFDNKRALADVREHVDIAKTKLPDATDEPRVNEVNVALFPVLTVALSGTLPERDLVRIARDIKDRIETLYGVLEVDIGGDREALMEVVVDPAVMETYGVNFTELFDLISNNLLVAAGAMDTGAGRLMPKVPGVVEDIDDMFAMPVKVEGDRVVTFGDVASVLRGFKDPERFARVGGLAAIVFSTAGVLMGLLVTAQPFGIVMVGLGIIALAGIVVNNNIVVIDTYNRMRRQCEASLDLTLALEA